MENDIGFLAKLKSVTRDIFSRIYRAD